MFATRLLSILFAFSCGALLAVFPVESDAEIGVKEPEWTTPPMVYELPHQLSVPRVENVLDIVKIGNFTRDGAMVEITLTGNGERVYGGTGEARRIGDDLYALVGDSIEHCTLLVHVGQFRIGIEGLPDGESSTQFCPTKIFWLPAKTRRGSSNVK